jgi:complement component 1 Q subcomponent-binding protein
MFRSVPFKAVKSLGQLARPAMRSALVGATRSTRMPVLLVGGLRYNSSASVQLKDVLKSELKISKAIPNELDQSYLDFLDKSGFKVEESEGKSNVQLVKTGDNGEIIRVFFDIDEVTDIPMNETNGEEEMDMEEEMESLDSLLCNVRVMVENPSKNDALFMNLFLQGSEASFLVDFVNYKTDASKFLSEDILTRGEYVDKFDYQGPRFSDLDESLQTGFETYLEECGISEELAEFIIGYSEFKEEREYRKWLGDLESFL